MISCLFPNSRMLWGLSPHSLWGDPGHCSTLPPRFAGSGNQGSGNPGFREPGFGARFREPKVPRTRVRLVSPVPGTRVPGTQGSGNQDSGQGSGNPRFREPGFEQGSGNNGFWLASGFRDVKVPGSQGSRTRFREP